MAELRCSYDSVYELAEKTRQDANELESHSKSSNNELNVELNSWTGDASTEYKDTENQINNETQAIADTMRAYADYLDEIADTVQEADDYCATAKI